MKAGDKFRIKNNSGVMDISIVKEVDKTDVRDVGIPVADGSKVRIECHDDGCYNFIFTVYIGGQQSRDIYIVEYSLGEVVYLLGHIDATEGENVPIYTTI